MGFANSATNAVGEIQRVFRTGDSPLPGPDYVCSSCKTHGLRLWRDSHIMLNQIELKCAECAEKTEADNIARYASFHQEYDPTIGNLVPARPTPDGDTFWGHTSGDVEWWYALPQYVDKDKELARVKFERDHFIRREQFASADWLKERRETARLRAERDELRAVVERWIHSGKGDLAAHDLLHRLAIEGVQTK